MSGTDADPPRDQLMQEAAIWFARMRGPNAESSRDEFENWLRRGALHRQAYNRAAEIFAMGKLLAEEDGQGAPERAGEDKGPASGRRLLAAMVGLLVLAMVGWIALRALPLSELTADQIAHDEAGHASPVQLLSTSAGRGRTIVLADGSVVTLDADTAIEVRLGTTERTLELQRGHARFQVYHEPRPFVVHAGGGSVTAHGTVFDVSISPDRHVTVRLIAGAVDVAFPAEAAPDRRPQATTRLRPGQALSYPAMSRQPIMTSAPTGASETPGPGVAPQPAQEYDGVAVAELIAAANRGSSLPIRLADTAIGQRHVSGRFRVDDTLLLAQRLVLLFDLTLDRRQPEEIVLRAR